MINNQSNIISLGSALLLSLVLSGILYFRLFMDTWDLFGIEEITNPERRHGKIVYTSLAITLFIAGIAIVLKLFRKRYASIGFMIPAVIGLYPLLMIGPTFIDKANYYEEFNQAKWLDGTEDRMKMARKLVETRELIGMSKEEIRNKLGPEDFNNGDMNYKIWDDCGLGFRFEGDSVTDYYVWARD